MTDAIRGTEATAPPLNPLLDRAVVPRLLDTATEWTSVGGSAIPCQHWGQKRPLHEFLPTDGEGKPVWGPLRETPLSPEAVRDAIVNQGVKALAAVCGRNGLLVFDFDNAFERLYPAWLEGIGSLPDGVLVVRTHSGRVQVWMYCDEAFPTQVLAHVEDQSSPSGRAVGIENRGSNSLAMLAGSTGPSGGMYGIISGSLSHIARVPAGRVYGMIDAARRLCESPIDKRVREAKLSALKEAAWRKEQRNLNGDISVIQEFNARHDLRDLLRSFGYADAGRRMKCPGGSTASVEFIDGGKRSVHYSADDFLADGHGHDAFDVVRLLQYGGDTRGAVRGEASKMGLNKQHSPQPSPSREEPDAGRAESAGGEWSPPPAPPAPAYRAFVPIPLEWFPEPLRSYVINQSQAIGCDPSFVAVPLLAMLAAAVGNNRRIRLKRGWVEACILWCFIIGGSGSQKSQSIDAAAEPLRKWQKRKSHENAKACEEYRKRMKVWSATPKDQRVGEEPEPPPPEVRREFNDATVAAAQQIHSENWAGLALVRDELGGWFASLGQYSGSSVADVNTWIEFYGGRQMTVHRKSTEQRKLNIPYASISIAGGIQPDALVHAVTPLYFANGFASRPLLTYPPKRQKKWSEVETDPVIDGSVCDLFEKLLSLTPDRDVNGAPAPREIPLSPTAKDLWAAFVDECGEVEFEQSDNRMAAALAKLTGAAARIALVIHMSRWAAGDATADPTLIDAHSIEAGIALTRWFTGEAERVYTLFDEPPAKRAARELFEYVAARGGSMTPAKLASHRTWGRGDREIARTNLNNAVQQGYGRWELPDKTGKPGRPGKEYFVANAAAISASTASTISATHTESFESGE